MIAAQTGKFKDEGTEILAACRASQDNSMCRNVAKTVGHDLEDKRHAPAGNQLITSIICASSTPISTMTGAWGDAASAGDCLGF